MPPPGQYLVTLSSPLPFRAAGLEVRDAITILTPGPVVQVAYILRYPLNGTVTQTALSYNTGALAIDACRVRTSDDTGRVRNTALGCLNDDAWKPTPAYYEGAPGGRWPTNLLLVHGVGCRPQGAKQVKGITGGQHVVRRSGVHTKAGGHQAVGREQPAPKHYCTDGLETVAAWDCQDDCPVRALDGQSGFLHGAGNKRVTQTSPFCNLGFTGLHSQEVNPDYHADPGGTASRFYPQFASLQEALDWLKTLISAPLV